VDDSEEGRRRAGQIKNPSGEDSGKHQVATTSNFLKDRPDAAAWVSTRILG
jgi:hypothetical protein